MEIIQVSGLYSLNWSGDVDLWKTGRIKEWNGQKDVPDYHWNHWLGVWSVWQKGILTVSVHWDHAKISINTNKFHGLSV